MQNTAETRDWDEKTLVGEGPTRAEVWHEEGRVDGRTYGPQTENHWKFVAYIRHPELGGKDRVTQIESFLRGMAQGLEERRTERLAYGFDEPDVDPEAPTLRSNAIPVAPVADPETVREGRRISGVVFARLK